VYFISFAQIFIVMETLVLTSRSKKDLELINLIAHKMGLSSRYLSNNEKEDIGLLKAMLQADRGDKVNRESVIKILDEKCN
jgi:hypothetical protein